MSAGPRQHQPLSRKRKREIADDYRRLMAGFTIEHSDIRRSADLLHAAGLYFAEALMRHAAFSRDVARLMASLAGDAAASFQAR